MKTACSEGVLTFRSLGIKGDCGPDGARAWPSWPEAESVSTSMVFRFKRGHYRTDRPRILCKIAYGDSAQIVFADTRNLRFELIEHLITRHGFKIAKLKGAFAHGVLCQELASYEEVLRLRKFHITYFLTLEAFELLQHRFLRRLKLEHVGKRECQLIQAGGLPGRHSGADFEGKSCLNQSLKEP